MTRYGIANYWAGFAGGSMAVCALYSKNLPEILSSFSHHDICPIAGGILDFPSGAWPSRSSSLSLVVSTRRRGNGVRHDNRAGGT